MRTWTVLALVKAMKVFKQVMSAARPEREASPSQEPRHRLAEAV
jgi:hypothetical protein